LLDEHNRLMFGSGAKPMGEFTRILESLWCRQVVARQLTLPWGLSAIRRRTLQFGKKSIPPASSFVANFTRSRNLRGVTRKENQYIRLWLFSSPGSVWFDDVRLRELPQQN